MTFGHLSHLFWLARSHGKAVDKMNLSRSDVLFQVNGECKSRLGCDKAWHGPTLLLDSFQYTFVRVYSLKISENMTRRALA